MIERIIKFSTLPGDSICDAFSGTGTVLRTIDNLTADIRQLDGWTHPARNPVTSIELSPTYCEKIATEHNLAVETFGQKAVA